MQLAQKLRRSLRGADASRRTALRLRAARAFRAVHLAHPDSAAAIEAAFRAGELWRAAGEHAAALAEFEYVVARGAETPFGARAALETAHLHRRSRSWAEALRWYEELALDASAAPGSREEAALWRGRVYERLERTEEALRCWERVVSTSLNPLRRLRAHDRIVRRHVEDGRRAAAARAIERCASDLFDEMRCETGPARRLRAAYARFRAGWCVTRSASGIAQPACVVPRTMRTEGVWTQWTSKVFLNFLLPGCSQGEDT